MKTRYAIKIVAGAILAAIGVLLPFLIDGIEALSSILVTIGFVTIAVAGVRHWRLKDELESDERRRNSGHTASHTHGCSPSSSSRSSSG